MATNGMAANGMATNGEPPSKRAKGAQNTDELRIKAITPLLPPACSIEDLPLDSALAAKICEWRGSIGRILRGEDNRLLVIVGPCSVHDPKAGLEYATRLRSFADSHKDTLLVVMRVYFEKPRTTVGWKGLINDPDLDGSFKINKGLRIAREFLLEINRLGLPVATEFLDTISPQFTADLVSWGAIGARTTESQVHREMASALGMPVGFKNGTSGDCQICVDAALSAAHAHAFLGVSKEGQACIVHSAGNKDGHIILRGGSDGPNYSEEHVAKAVSTVVKNKGRPHLIVDCSHANSKKKHENQPLVAADLAARIAAGDNKVAGVMLESFLVCGSQSIVPGQQLTYGKSVTDACMDWSTTVEVLQGLSKAVATRRTDAGGQAVAAMPQIKFTASFPGTKLTTKDLKHRLGSVEQPLLSPACLIEDLPCDIAAASTVTSGRNACARILEGTDDRLLVIVGPCSIHDPKAGLEYAEKLREQAEKHKDTLLVVMRVYFEKPRTTVGWKGLINDPDLDDSFQINKGLRIAREFLLKINQLGVPTGCEFLDTISPQFTADLVSWGAIGARTTESQVHREMASGLSMPVGFKNGTSGDCQIAADAVKAAAHEHLILGVSKQGLACIVRTGGNKDGHIILRGGSDGPNFSEKHVSAAVDLMVKNKQRPHLIVDCSHGNSQKKHENQPKVAADLGSRIAAGDRKVAGVMIESFLEAGNQKIVPDTPLVYGKSVTDACIDWPTTVDVLDALAKAVQARRQLK